MLICIPGFRCCSKLSLVALMSLLFSCKSQRFSIIFTEHQPELTCVIVSDQCCPDVSAVIKTPPVGNILIQMDDPDCNSDSGGSSPSVCLDDLFQLRNLDSCFRGEGLLTIRVMTVYELSGPSRRPLRGPVCSKQRGCDDSSAASLSSWPSGSSQYMCKHSLRERQQLTSHRRHPNAAAHWKNSTVDYSWKVEQKQYEK